MNWTDRIQVFKTIPDYEGLYSVNVDGKVKSLRRNTRVEFLTQGIYSVGYKGVYLTNNDKGKRVRVHRLVALAFIPNPENKPCVNHIDGNKLNNNVNNLEWCTYSENIIHGFRIGIYKSKLSRSDVDEIQSLYDSGLTQKEIGKIFNVSTASICKVLKKENIDRFL